MAYLSRRDGGRIEVRESVATPRGPRSRTLASFRGALTPGVLERAAARARRPLDRDAVRRRARAMGIPVASAASIPEARRLLAHLRGGGGLDPLLARRLREALEPLAARPVPEDLAEVAEWLGAGFAERGRALRGLLRTYDRIAGAGPGAPPRRAARRPRFPRLSSADVPA